ncbi:WGxxGxxG family protein [Paenibacillus contaminans]|uniref:WGxxGxxG-CTERM domain-containing protein n=1 Tax=Paenibacillus contaminans TaxID=450362 RepID=A0A329MSU6_9BACL|nr:WGxxGxxG family protein [Paenibacillus contaminans]RAV23015.1 hypothetical protein DQG23_02105 [Paenibacillus contaminans]
MNKLSKTSLVLSLCSLLLAAPAFATGTAMPNPGTTGTHTAAPGTTTQNMTSVNPPSGHGVTGYSTRTYATTGNARNNWGWLGLLGLLGLAGMRGRSRNPEKQ